MPNTLPSMFLSHIALRREGDTIREDIHGKNVKHRAISLQTTCAHLRTRQMIQILLALVNNKTGIHTKISLACYDEQSAR